MPDDRMASGWLDPELHPVVLRLARADECMFQIGRLAMSWSAAGPVQLAMRREGNEVVTFVNTIRPIPPLVAMLFSEAANHLRAALDNTVWHMVLRGQASPLTASAERSVAMPITADDVGFDNWMSRRAAVTAFGDSATLRPRLHRLQPYVDVHSSLPSVGATLAAMMGVKPESAYPLLLLQAYSNEDKHRSIRVAVERTIVRREDWRFFGQDRSFQDLKVGDVLGRTALGKYVELTTNTAMVVERPDPFHAFVSPVNELHQLREYLADIAIPILVTGMALPRSLPPHIDLSDNGRKLEERIFDGEWDAATARLGPLTAEKMADAASAPPTVPRITHDPAEGDAPPPDGE